ncbi:unnamed protein product [Arabidopsis lyrata]|uniref:Transmembrane protein n=1 Tax=Arabidopsis lyrata subsp. lyrata TaxID=81972 RepID=D7L148_ARALL|nr:uncharacterized protein LOC9320226 [Arabidopsis lyrata subsp. lyrata]EFH62473.1 hypothetical protein ARALYDRAFT_480796 [Arabidopsis lyrata subsp. lyrata]CAH8262376.1 unnamed protein product [Arabidopsis lyrata]|eukprot:XP_020889524.1 uncharacterized protein LOC9320226 [Arabidopsis lyrata subsp. lyrata]
MASPTNKTPSFSPPIPNRPNPKPRNSEAGDPLRRSFGGNPFPGNTKINIPSDYSRRNSFGGDKENETKPVLTPKSSKNFMSPTISAVSKINPSPRKRVLSDKNEMSRSFSDVKGLILEDDSKRNHHRAKSCVSFSDVLHTICVDEKKKFVESHDMTVTDFDEKEVYENKGITYSDPRFRISPRPSVPYTSPEFAACEVDTLLPPYDPKKNFLSPRPQFLHYKPNPRIEKRFDECKQLEELFISESSSSETELSVEESEEQENDGAEVVVEDETKDVEQSEAESDEEMVCESVKETTSPVPKQSGFRKFKFLGWFLALAMAYLLVSATFSPPMKSSFNQFHIPREITEFAKANNLDKLSEKLYTLTESSLVYMDKLISSLGGGNEVYGQLQFHNLTYTLEDNTVFQSTSVEINEEPLQEKSKVETNLEDVYIEDGSVNEFEEESGTEENSEVVSDAETNGFDEQAEVKLSTDIESNDGEGNLKALFEDGLELTIEKLRESEMSPEENNDARGSEPEEKLETGSTKKKLEETESEAIYINQQKESEVAGAESGSKEAFEETAAETSDDLHPKVRSSNKTDNDSTKAVIVLSSTVLVLLAVASFLFAKKTKPVAPKPYPETTMELNLGHVPVEKPFSLNFEEEVDDRMSNSFHQSEGGKKNNKNSSSSKLRRESMASSASEYSVGSFSYGSFTTYEKIPIKSGDREEEMITPVRRSSRIRNKPSGGL